MKKLFLYSSLIFFQSTIVFSQIRWDSLPGKLQSPDAVLVMYADSNYLYVAGNSYLVGGIHAKGIERWNGVKWDSMGAGINGLDTLNFYPQNTWAITTYQNKLYVGGEFTSLGAVNANSIGTWNGSAWDSLAVQPFKNSYSLSGFIAMNVINNKIYVGGGFDSIAGLQCYGIAQWDGSNWSSLNFPTLANFEEVSAICEYNGSIYTGGIFYGNVPGDTNSNILRCNGTGWQSVGGGIKGGLVDIWSMIVYNGELYVAGEFSKSDGNAGNNIQRWNGTSWNDVGGGTNFTVRHLIIFNSKLYAMGTFATAGGIPVSDIAEWDGTKWCSLGSTFDNAIETACIYKDSLYIGGGFWTIDRDSISYLAKWTGGDYTDSCGNDATGINKLQVDNEEITAYPNPSAGIFTLTCHSKQGEESLPVIKVFNVLGQQVLTETLHSLQHDNTIDISNQPNGIYLYRVMNEDGTLIGEGKVVVQK